VTSVADPDPGSGAFLTPGSGIRDGKKSDPGSGINIPDSQHCFVTDADPGDPKHTDPQH
jgi:hypothetical protein